MDITQLIIDDHHEHRRLFALIDQLTAAEPEALRAVWGRLHALLDTHAEAEERFFYPAVLKIGSGAADADSADDETKDAIKDHNEIRDAAAAVAKEELCSKKWFAAVAKANEANGDHMAEEERQALADFRRHGDAALSRRLAIDFATFTSANLTGVAPVDKDPGDYIKEHRG